MPTVTGVLLEFSDGTVKRVTPEAARKHLELVVVEVPAPTDLRRVEPTSGARPYNATFFDDDDNVVHTTSPHETWTQAKDAALDWAATYGESARQFEIMKWTRQGIIEAPQRGSVRVRSRTRWHIAED